MSSNALMAELCPIISTLSTPDLAPILARSNFHSFSHLLSAFQDSVDKVNVRSSTYEARLWPKFAVRFVERALPPRFSEAAAGGTSMGRARSGTGGTQGGLPHMPSATDPAPSDASAPAVPAPPTPSTPHYTPNQGERDELFLDSLSSLISQRVSGWLAEDGRPELSVRGARLKSKPRGEDDPPLPIEPDVDEGWRGRTLDQITPWYCALRDEVLRRREMVEWETFSWPVGCLLALSTSGPDPLNALAALWDLTSRDNLFSPSSFPPRTGAEEDGRQEWANPDVLRYIVLVHDFGAGGGREGWEDAQKLHDTIRKTYGLHTALLPLFSASLFASPSQPRAPNVATLWKNPSFFPTTRRESFEVGLGIDGGSKPERSEVTSDGPDFGTELSEDDLKAIRVFIREMVVQSLLPWMERSVIVGNEQFTAAKKSIGGRLWGAGRKYFGGNARASSPVSATGAPIGFNMVKGYYPHAAQESQSRRLSDLAFMIGDYSLAASVYEQASKDYKTDRAWRYFSAASRMAGLSQLLLHPANTPLNFNPDAWLDQALQTPLATATPIMDLDGLKAMMMYYEVYRAIGDWRAAPAGLVRTAGESDEIASAVLLEQAAISDLHLPMSSKRKFAFHMAMAATRYEKSGLKALSRRCLAQSASLYRIPPPTPDDLRCPGPTQNWNAVRSYLHHGLGRQAYNVGKAGDAVEHFLELLVGSDVQGDEAAGEESWLDDFGLAWEHLGTDAAEFVKERDLKIHATIFDPRDVHVRIHQNTEGGSSTINELAWGELEMEMLKTGFTHLSRKPTTLTRAGKHNEAIVGETFYLELRARNPLDAALAIGGLKIDTDAEPGTVDVDPPQGIELGPREALRIYVPVKSKVLTSFAFTQIHYRFNDLLPCTETLVRKPKRVQSTRQQPSLPNRSPNSALAVSVSSPIPILSVGLEDSPESLLAGEARSSSMTVTNTGQVALTDLKVLCSHPSFVLLGSQSVDTLYAASPATPHEAIIDIPNHLFLNTPFSIPLPDATASGDAILPPGGSLTIPVLWRGDAQGSHLIRWLFAFRGIDSADYLTGRASSTLEVLPSFQIRPLIRPSETQSDFYVLGVEATNAFVPDDIVITQVASFSPHWKVQSTNACFPATVGWQQSTNLLVNVDPLKDVPYTGSITAFVVDQLDTLLQGKDATKQIPGIVQLRLASLGSDAARLDPSNPILLDSILQTHRRLRRSSLATQLPTIPTLIQQNVFPLFGDRSLDLVVFWTIPASGRRGHHHLTDLPFGAGTNSLQRVLDVAELKAGGLYAESQRERSALLAGLRRSELGVDENPVVVTLAYSDSVEHDFETGPCSQTVSFVIRNLSPSEPMAFRLLLQCSAAAGTSSSTMAYTGNLTHTGRIPPLGSARVIAPLWLPREGVFNVGDWLVEGFAGGQSWYKQGVRRDLRVRAKP